MSASPQAPEVRPSIVLVEDDEDVREMMREVLESLGHGVVTANDGESGVELILRVRPDVALIDIHLPGIDGCEVATRVRAHLGPTQVRLIALTALGFAADFARSERAGFEAHLVKPPDLEHLAWLLTRPPGPAA